MRLIFILNKDKQMSKNKPYFQIYKKEGKIGHVRYKYVDENGKEHIRGLSATSPVFGKTIYEKGAKDSNGIDVNDKQYIAGDKNYLNEEQSKTIKTKIKEQDKNSDNMKYNMKENNCTDLVQEVIEEVYVGKIVNDFLNKEQKKDFSASGSYDTVKHDYIPKVEMVIDAGKFIKNKTEENKKKAFLQKEREKKAKKLKETNENLDFIEKTLKKELNMTTLSDNNAFRQTPKPLSEDEVRELMKSEAYNNKYHPDYEKTQNKVRKAYEELYSEDDRNENPDNYYVWKAVGGGKTRSLHADRDGEVFCWDNPPEGGHPGEDYNSLYLRKIHSS